MRGNAGSKGLIKIDPVDTLQVFELTNDGEDVALGRSVVDGVLRPRPSVLIKHGLPLHGFPINQDVKNSMNRCFQ